MPMPLVYHIKQFFQTVVFTFVLRKIHLAPGIGKPRPFQNFECDPISDRLSGLCSKLCSIRKLPARKIASGVFGSGVLIAVGRHIPFTDTTRAQDFVDNFYSFDLFFRRLYRQPPRPSAVIPQKRSDHLWASFSATQFPFRIGSFLSD